MIKRTGKPCIKEEMLTETLNDKNFFFFLLGCEGENLTDYVQNSFGYEKEGKFSQGVL